MVSTVTPSSRLSMRDIAKRFGAVAALSDASLDVAAGEVHALVGQNGAGKSTLIKVLTGFHRRDRGEVTFDGRPFEASSPGDAQAKGIATIYQEVNLVGFRSVAENIGLGRRFSRFGLLDRGRMEAEARALLGRFNLDIDVRRSLDAYPIATQQMVAIARAIGFEASSSSWTSRPPRSTTARWRACSPSSGAEAADGVSTVFVSHKLDELFAVCDRVTIMRDGTTVGSAPWPRCPSSTSWPPCWGATSPPWRAGAPPGFGAKAAGPAAGASPSSKRTPCAGRRSSMTCALRSHGRDRRPVGAARLGPHRERPAPLRGRPARRGRDPLDGHPTRRRARAGHPAGLGFCTEDRKHEGIVPDLSVRENLTLALMPRLTRPGIVDEGRQRAIVERFVNRLGIKCSSPEQPIRELSGGNQQKVLLARWLCTDPKLLILDEPTRGIDVGAKAEIQALIRELAGTGLAVLMVSSEIEEIVEGSDRAYVLRDGRTVAMLENDSLTEEAVLLAMAHGDAAEHRRHEETVSP